MRGMLYHTAFPDVAVAELLAEVERQFCYAQQFCHTKREMLLSTKVEKCRVLSSNRWKVGPAFHHFLVVL